MKTVLSLILLTYSSVLWSQNSLVGSWQTQYTDDSNRKIIINTIMTDTYFADTYYVESTGEFIRTLGGTYSIDGKTISETFEFDTEQSDRVGTTTSFILKFKDSKTVVVDGKRTWTQVDSGDPGKLAGAWLISGRMRDGQLSEMNPGPRKTMKILSGTRFQWIAYNTETKEFFGTGGGTYSTENGIYTENIEFFSRDNSRVGASLSFSFELKDDDWHHSGKSSRGDDIYEIWRLR